MINLAAVPFTGQRLSRRVLVAHNVPRHGCGGMARMMEASHQALESFGWETHFFTSNDMPASAGQRYRRYAFSWYVRDHVRKAFLSGVPYDIVNVHEPAGAALVLGRSRIGRPAIVAMTHGLEQRYWEMRQSNGADSPEPPNLKERVTAPLFSLWQSHLTLCRSDHVLCLNEEDRSFLRDRYRLDASRTTRVFPGASPEFSAVAPRRSYVCSGTRVLFSGSWIQRKGIRQVVQAFSSLASRRPALQLGILGAGLPAGRVLADFEESLRSQIVVHPPLSHAQCAELLLDYDIFLLPSFFEGTPLALIEAMCTGMPVITTSTAGMKDVVQDGHNGILVTPGNSDQIVRAVERLIADAGLRQMLGRRASCEASRNYTWQAVAEIVDRVYSVLQLQRNQTFPR